MQVTLEQNGWFLLADNEVLYDILISMATHVLSRDEFMQRVRELARRDVR
jgi:hypothetical protein